MGPNFFAKLISACSHGLNVGKKVVHKIWLFWGAGQKGQIVKMSRPWN